MGSILLPISFLISISIMYFLPFTPTFLIYIPAALFPFILGGMITSIIFTERSDYSNKLYLMDLFGAGLGSLLIIKLMNSFGFLRSVLVLMCVLFINNNLIETIGKKFNSYYTSPVTVIGSYKNTNDKVEILFSKWDAISKTDVLDIKSDNEKLIVLMEELLLLL
jgi:hypothetical protein